MQFEDLQAIWDTQNERPVFAMNDARLAVGLYQQREQARRRLFKQQFLPIYWTVPMLMGFSVFLFLAYFGKTLYQTRSTDPPMTVWDGAALIAAATASLALIVPMYRERKRHEHSQNVFAPTLREELERGIAQLDFELSFHSRPRAYRVLALVSFGATVMIVETARLNGNPIPWLQLAFISFSICFSAWASVAKSNKAVAQLMERKRALESMHAGLEG